MHDFSNQCQQPPFQITAACAAITSLFLSVAPASAVTFSTPDGVSGTPRTQTSGGASRSSGQCLSQVRTATSGATALLPPATEALTVSNRPTFFVYVPPTTAEEASFSLQDERGELAYQTKVTLPKNGGTISIPLPETASTLQIGKTYKWFFEIHCMAQFDPDNPIVEGSVSRTSIDRALEGQLASSQNAVDKAQLYSEAGIWYDTIGTLAQARQAQPQDPALARNWHELLTSVGLEEVADRPLVEGFSVATSGK